MHRSKHREVLFLLHEVHHLVVRSHHELRAKDYSEIYRQQGADPIQVGLIIQKLSLDYFSRCGVLIVLELGPHQAVSNGYSESFSEEVPARSKELEPSEHHDRIEDLRVALKIDLAALIHIDVPH